MASVFARVALVPAMQGAALRQITRTNIVCPLFCRSLATSSDSEEAKTGSPNTKTTDSIFSVSPVQRPATAISPTAATDMVRASKSISEVCTAVNAFAATKPQHGHVAFINSVLDHIDKNKLKIDVPTCDALFSVFPTENSFRTKSLFDVLWPQNTLQSTCTMNLLQRMEEGFVIPETSTYDILYERFGKASVPVRKCRRLTYWLRRFYSANPFAPSGPPPADALETRRLLVQRLYAGLEDPVFLDVPDGAAAHTAAQIKRLDEFIRAGETVRVRGPHLTWHSGAQHKYMVLEVGTSSLTADHIVGVCTEPISPEAATAWLAVLRSACPALDTAHIAVQLEEHRVDPAPPGSVPDAELA